MKILITGAQGFIANYFRQVKAVSIVYVSRTADDEDTVSWDNLQSERASVFNSLDVVIHLAGRAHRIKKSNSLAEQHAMNEANVELTRKLCHEVFAHSHARLVYISSLAVYGDNPPQPISEDTPCNPTTVYGCSKLRGEEVVKDLALAYAREYVIVRAPLIYGADAPANFGALRELALRGVPLPFGLANAPRAMMGVHDFVEFLLLVAKHPAAKNQTYVINDEPHRSTAEMVKRIQGLAGIKSLLLPIPAPVLRYPLSLMGKGHMVGQLFDPLLVDTTKAQSQLGWQSPFNPDDSLGLPSVSAPRGIDRRMMDYLGRRYATERLVALLMLAALSPVLALLSWLIRRDSPGPALFTQQRAGKGHQPFKIYKFRTMRVDAPQLSTEDMQKAGINPVTRVGRFLRRTSLDELPQLINVLKGEMSFLGPRPALMTQERVLRLREASGVHGVLPGITGYAQVTGRDDLSDEEKVSRDTFYLEHLGPRLDVKIIVMTFFSVFKGTGTK